MIKILSKFCGYSSLPILLASIALLPPASAQTSNETAEPPAVIANKSIDTADSRSAGRPHDEGFLIGPDDVLAVNVWKEPEISRAVPVRSDGKISLPLVGEVQATGRTPLQLEQDIATRLKNYIAEPEVTVIIQQINSQKF